jgi:hypothetical protein
MISFSGRRLILLPLVLFLLLPGCSSPQPSALHESIPLGQTVLSVQGGEMHAVGGKHALVLFMRWTGPREEKAKLTNRLWVMRRHFKVVDGGGNTYYPSQVMDEYSWRSLQQQRHPAATHRQQLEYDKLGMGEEFVMLFEVPEGISELTFIVKNPWHEKGQPRRAAVRLGL